MATIAAPLVDGLASPPEVGAPIDITSNVTGDKLTWRSPQGRHAIWFVFQHRVDHLVAGGAFPSAGGPAHVIDHLDLAAAKVWLAEQAGAWLDALAPLVPDEVFVDSFELVGELPWSEAFATRFAERYGYPIWPNLPFALRAQGESKYAALLEGSAGPAYVAEDGREARVREDYEELRGLLFLESFVAPLSELSAARKTSLRLQGHGGYAHVLDAYAQAELPESEGLFALGSMDFLELAASAAHVFGRSLVSSESFVAVSPLGPALSEEEMWMLSGRAYTAGIQRLMFHGIAYPYQRSNGARWFPFHPDALGGVVSAGPFDITSDLRPGEPSWQFLPAFNAALTRLTYAMTRGEDRAEVAWLMHEREIPDASGLRVGELPSEQGESSTSLALRRAGYRYDRISPSMLAHSSASGAELVVGHARYRALLITDWGAAHPEELAAVTRALDAGVPVIARGTLPTRARGFANAAARDAEVASQLAAQRARIQSVGDDAAIAPALTAAAVLPDIGIVQSDCDTVSLAERAVENGHVFLIFNEAARPCDATLALHVPAKRALLLDPQTGFETMVARADEVSVALKAQRPVVLFVQP